MGKHEGSAMVARLPGAQHSVAAMPDLPTGTITFLFTDIEGSTRRWEQQPELMHVTLARHDHILRAAVETNSGYVVKTTGDGLHAAFRAASDGLRATLDAQRGLVATRWGDAGPIRVRMGLHTGEAERRDNDYYGPALNRAARLMAVGHGGQILLSAATQELVRDGLPEGVSLRDLGEHRFKDLQRAEHVYQVVGPDLAVDFPPLRTLEAHPNNLPRQLTSFVGREKELAEIVQLLGHHPLVTLTGPGGTGKTRHAIQVAADVLEHYPDGVWLVELASLGDPALVPQAVATAIGVREEPGRQLVATILDALRTRRLLLVLDNCEHLLDACAGFADALLRSCPQVQVLATSREALGIGGETSWRISSLLLPDATERPLLDDLRHNEAVRLFLERAGAVNARVQLTQQNAPAVVQICRRLDGIPLALELAAARLRAMTIEQLLARMDQRFRLLTGGSRAALPRQQTLQALVDWSYDLLSEPERRLFQRLSVFSGGFTLEAAEAVASGDGVEDADVLDLLGQLVGKSLVLAEEQPDGSQRYGLLETLRQYGREKLVISGEAEAVLSRHAAYFVALAAEAVPPGAPPAREDWREYLTPEHDNLRGALGWLIERQDVAQVPALAWPIAYLWAVSGNDSEGRRQSGAIMALPGLAGPTKGRAEMLFCAVFFAARVGEFAIAVRLGEERLAITRQLGDPRPIASALTLLGAHYVQLGDYAKAQALQEQSLAIWQQLGDQAQMADVLIRLGEAAHMVGEYDRAELRYTEGLQTARASSVHMAIGRALHHLGSLALDRGDYRRAHEHFRESVQVHWQHKHAVWYHYALADIASLAAAEGQVERAVRLGGTSTAYATASESAIQPSEIGRFKRWMATARQQLPAVQADAAGTQGMTMPLEAAFADALADDRRSSEAKVR
jgi:predicted ATPase/class 3 adenylate cyclase